MSTKRKFQFQECGHNGIQPTAYAIAKAYRKLMKARKEPEVVNGKCNFEVLCQAVVTIIPDCNQCTYVGDLLEAAKYARTWLIRPKREDE